MALTRRDTLLLGSSALAASMLGLPAFAATEDPVAAFTGGAETTADGITLTAPEIAENGNTVPIAVDAPGATAITVFAMGNPLPGVVTFNFGPLAASQAASTRIRLARTQDVVAVAKMADGSFRQTSATVKVTIGGCGG